MEHAQENDSKPPKPPKLVFLLTFMAAIGGYLFGYNTGVISGAIVILADTWHLNDIWQELIVSATVAGAAIFSVVGGLANQRFGRKPVILVSSFLFIIGSIIMAFCNSRGLMLLGRLTVGSAIGMSSATIPAYVCEASPPQGRGSLITVFQLMITFGFFVAGIFNAGFSYLSDDISWRLMLGVAGIPAIFQLIGFLFMPESPRWEATNGDPEKAKIILKKLNHSDGAAEKEFFEIMADHEEMQQALEQLGGTNAFVSILKTPRFRRALVVGSLIHMFAQLSGINTVMYYSGSIVEMAGEEDETTQMWIIVGIYAVNFFCTFIGIYLVEKIGRRKLLLLSIAGCAISLAVLGGSFLAISLTSPQLEPNHAVATRSVDETCFNYQAIMCLDDFSLLLFLHFASKQSEFYCGNWPMHVLFREAFGTAENGAHLKQSCDACSYDEKCGYCFNAANTSSMGLCMHIGEHKKVAWIGECSSNGTKTASRDSHWVFTHGFCPTKLSFLPIIGMVLYLFCFSTGLGPMPWTINAEIYPNWARSTGTAFTTAVCWSFNLIICLTFLTLARAITRQGAFFLYSGITTIGFMVVFLLVPETKNISMEEVETLFKHGWFQYNRKGHVTSSS